MWYYDHVKSDSVSHYEISLSFYGGMAMDIAGKEKVISWSASIGIHFCLLIAAAAMGLFAVAAPPDKRPIDVEIYDTAAPASEAAPAAQAAKNATEAAQDGNPALQQLFGMTQV